VLWHLKVTLEKVNQSLKVISRSKDHIEKNYIYLFIANKIIKYLQDFYTWLNIFQVIP